MLDPQELWSQGVRGLPPTISQLCSFVCWVGRLWRRGARAELGPPRLARRWALGKRCWELVDPRGWPGCIRHRDTLVTVLPKPSAAWLIFHSPFIFSIFLR